MEQPWESPDDSGGPGITPGQAVLSAALDRADAAALMATVEEAPTEWPGNVEGWLRGARLVTGSAWKAALSWQGIRLEADRLAREADRVQAEVQMLRRVAWGLAGLVLVQALLLAAAVGLLLAQVT